MSSQISEIASSFSREAGVADTRYGMNRGMAGVSRLYLPGGKPNYLENAFVKPSLLPVINIRTPDPSSRARDL